MPDTISPTLARKILDIAGERGRLWLESLPSLLEDFARRWSLTIQPRFAELSYNYVAPVLRADGFPAVLKAGLPGLGFTREIEALRLFDGQGICQLLEADPEQGVMLLERVIPGTTLRDEPVKEETKTLIAAQVMKRLWKPVQETPSFDTVQGYAQDLEELRRFFDGGYGPFPPVMIDKAEMVFRSLLSAGHPNYLIHGDFHACNILRSERQGWLAIDPKGVTGDPLFDIADYACDLPEEAGKNELAALLSSRVETLAEVLCQDRRAILDWSYAELVLRGWWFFEDHGTGWETAFHRAELVESIY